MSTQIRQNEAPLLVGLAIVGVGVVVIADRVAPGNADLSDTIVFSAFAALLLVATIAARSHGALIAALAFAGLAAAKYAVMSGEDSGGAVLLGPGVGFLMAYAIGTLAFGPRHWWPLVPGAVMAWLGGLLVFGGEAGAALAGATWPVVLVGVGILMVAGVSAIRRPRPR